MLRRSRSLQLALSLLVLAILACNLPGSAPSAQGTESPSVIFSDTPAPVQSTNTPIASNTAVPSVAACPPKVTTNVVSNVRSGPGQVYDIIGNLPQGAAAMVAGKSFDSTWWYIEFPGGAGGYAWISTTVTTAECIPPTLALITAPPTPILPSSTPTLVANIQSATPTLGLIIIDPSLLWTKTPTPTSIVIILPTLIKIPFP